MGEKAKKIVAIVIAIVVGLLTCGGIVTSFLLNYNTTAPNAISVFDDGEVVGLIADMNDNYKGYIFKFKKDYQDEILIENEENILTVSTMLENDIKVGGEYNVSVCYKAENSGNNSEFSEAVRWKVYDYLQAPVLSHNEENNKLEWQAVDNADYYEVCYNTKDGVKKLRIEDNYLDLQTVEGGQRSFVVISKSETENYKSKTCANPLSISVLHHLEEFISVTFNEETKDIQIVGKENLSKIMVYIGDTSYEQNEQFVYNANNKTYVCTFNLTAVYPILNEDDEPPTIGASPISIDEYNVFDGEVTYYIAE